MNISAQTATHRFSLNSFQLKIIAIITMIIDHVGLLLFPQYAILRIIGRVSFPIFCFLISEGCIHTSNIKKYLFRLGLFAIISQFPFNIFLTGRLFYFRGYILDIIPMYFYGLNVFFTLFLGALSIVIAKKMKIYFSVPLIILLATLAELFHTDYGAFGVILIVVYWLLRKNVLHRAIGGSALCLVNGLIRQSSWNAWPAIAGIPILLYNGEKGKHSLKYFFYVFYPLHLLIIFLIRIMFF